MPSQKLTRPVLSSLPQQGMTVECQSAFRHWMIWLLPSPPLVEKEPFQPSRANREMQCLLSARTRRIFLQRFLMLEQSWMLQGLEWG